MEVSARLVKKMKKRFLNVRVKQSQIRRKSFGTLVTVLKLKLQKFELSAKKIIASQRLKKFRNRKFGTESRLTV